MAADVRSIADLREWHAALGVYRTAVLEALGGTDMEVRRASDWLAEQLGRWRRLVRECEEAVTQAKAELAARRFPGFDGRMPDTSVQEEVLRKAKARLQYCDDQVEKVRAWMVKLPRLVDEVYSGPARRLGNFLEIDLAAGLALLARKIASLDAYAEEKKT